MNNATKKQKIYIKGLVSACAQGRPQARCLRFPADADLDRWLDSLSIAQADALIRCLRALLYSPSLNQLPILFPHDQPT